jgi:transposase-like protein
MSNHRKRVNDAGEEKVAILMAHFVEGLPVSEVCRKYDISVTNFYNWQKILFEGAAQLIDRKPNAANVRRQEAAAEKKVEAMEAKLVQNNEVVA